MNNHVKEVLIALAVIYCVVSIGSFIHGALNADFNDCYKTYHSDFVFPARKVGCWFAGETEYSRQSDQR